MSLAEEENSDYRKLLSRNFRTLTITYTILMPLGFATIGVIAHGKDSKVPLWLLIVLALICGAAAGLIMGYSAKWLWLWLFPAKPDSVKMKIGLLSLAILALLTTWAHWSDVPTNAQIDAIHSDPRFAAAIAEVNEKHMNADLLAAAMRNGHAHVSRYAVFTIEAVAEFVAIGFLFVAYLVIFNILASTFRFKGRTKDIAAE